MTFFHSRHHFKIDGIEIVYRPHTAQDDMPHAGRTVHGETHADQAVNNFLNMRLLGALLHYD
jgi:hypothetical protein